MRFDDLVVQRGSAVRNGAGCRHRRHRQHRQHRRRDGRVSRDRAGMETACWRWPAGAAAASRVAHQTLDRLEISAALLGRWIGLVDEAIALAEQSGLAPLPAEAGSLKPADAATLWQALGRARARLKSAARTFRRIAGTTRAINTPLRSGPGIQAVEPFNLLQRVDHIEDLGHRQRRIGVEGPRAQIGTIAGLLIEGTRTDRAPLPPGSSIDRTALTPPPVPGTTGRARTRPWRLSRPSASHRGQRRARSCCEGNRPSLSASNCANRRLVIGVYRQARTSHRPSCRGRRSPAPAAAPLLEGS